MDRIVVGVDKNWFVCAVYVSEHYKRKATYRISENLCRQISLQNDYTTRTVHYRTTYIYTWWLNFIPDRSRPGLTTTAIGAVDLQGAGGNWATVGRRSRGGRRVRRQREKRKGKSVGLRIGTLNVGTMTGKGRELADVMERRKVDILCVQETRWKGSKARSIGAGFKLFYYGVDSKRNGVGVVLKEEFVRNVLEVKRVSDRVMSLKLEIEGVMLNVVSGYAPQVGCELEEKERFWSELDEVMESIPTGERVVIGADFNGHVGEGNTGDEEVMGKFGVKERNLEGQMVVDFAKRMDMAVVNTYFQKREEHRVTYKSGGRSTQVDYILCRRGNLKEISDCKVVVGESVARQHRMVVCRMTLMVCKKKRSKIEIEKKTKWWKLKKEECCEEFRQKLRQALGGQVVLPDDWETTAEVIRETGRKVLGVSSGRRKEDKETWWWNEEVQDSIQRKRLAKKKWDMDRTEENRQEYKELQRRVKREVSKAKQKAYDELYTRLDTREGEKDLYRLPVLFTLADLDATGFGVPWPRHGRELLHWFLKNIQRHNYNTDEFCNPDEEDYGFHEFKNREKLLPNGWWYYTLALIDFGAGGSFNFNIPTELMASVLIKNLAKNLDLLQNWQPSKRNKNFPGASYPSGPTQLGRARLKDGQWEKWCFIGQYHRTDRRQAQQLPVEANKAAFQDLLPAEADSTARPDVVTTQEPLPAETNVTAS
ncbi:hypothetical protein QTP70_007591 [Hemibagrus guttatus]|uniref:Endonuclease/exonuclease/phosphatase domain-containing protein n=1 Tax=Hemibagrus guttatus TaxID=175788 RepID=A0AAE0VF19_9TELE|nr:hypothetical protein QTP70_007591 [Hemibagrus guttatus]